VEHDIKLFFVVKQYDPFNKRWKNISHYSKSGNFLGQAIFETEQEAQEYLEQYERKLSLASIDISSSSSNEPNGIKGRIRRYQYIELKVFQESTLPAVI
jgi:hypothetical protein